MKVLLLGGNGQLGRGFITDGGLARLGSLGVASRDGLIDGKAGGIVADLASPETLAAVLDSERPDVIVNAAAYTAVDRAEQEEALATRINADALAVVGRWAAAHGALVVHFSTDYVFDGLGNAPYGEDAATAPQGAYGRSKRAGELALAQSGAPHFTFRTAWVFSPVGQNFLRTMLRLGGEREELRVVADQRGTPTSTAVIVAGTLAAIHHWLAADPQARKAMEGTYHLTASGDTTWHGFAENLLRGAAERGLIPRMPRVTPITTADFPTPARRPAYSVLDTGRFARTFGVHVPEWQAGVEQVLAALSEPTE